jgi:acetylornithine deacetylase/succinyl-diaminopimelate desuccinylase-like protein
MIFWRPGCPITWICCGRWWRSTALRLTRPASINSVSSRKICSPAWDLRPNTSRQPTSCTATTWRSRASAARPGAPKIGLTSHLDTVYPPAEERANDFTWRVAGERLYGPGTVDIKGGTLMILMLLEALQHAAPALFEAVTWVVLLNAAEEVLAPDFGDLLRERLAGATLANLVFEGGKWNGREGQLVVARKGMACYRIEVVGQGRPRRRRPRPGR